MAGNILWCSGNVVSGFGLQASGQGAQVTNGTCVACSGILDNTGASGGPVFNGSAELVCSASGFAAAVSAYTTIDFYMVPSRDGTNYPDGGTTGGTPPANHLRGSFVVANSGNARMRMTVEGFPLLPLKYTGVIKNNTGQTLTSGWTILLDGFQEAYT